MSDSEDELTAGYRRFRAEHWPTARAEYETLATKGQKPHTLIVACSDSRADPALIFDAKPGELFVVRNVANLVPPYEPDGKLHGVSAALEFGVKVLGVKRIVVMGHAHCGGVNAMINGALKSSPTSSPPGSPKARQSSSTSPKPSPPTSWSAPPKRPSCGCRSGTCAPSPGSPSAKPRASFSSAACISASPRAP